jgi:hypothetical protein
VNDTEERSYSNAIGPTTQATSSVNSQVFYAKNIAGGTSDTDTANFSASTISTGNAGDRFGSMQASGGNLAADNNAQQHAKASSSASGNWVMRMGTFRDSGNLWSGSQSTARPRSRIDVTEYGAKGDGVTNDTSAITNAINEACAAKIGGVNVYPEVDFPPGQYVVSQPQTPSTAPVFEIPCSHLTLTGLGTSGTLQFVRSPAAEISVNAGASPNGAPVFDVRSTSVYSGFTMRDLEVNGYNKALWIYGTPDAKLENVTLLVQNTALADNSALELTNLIWFEWHGGECGGIEAANKYCILMTGDVPIISGQVPGVGLVEFDNLQGFGGAVRYDQRVNTTGGGPGNFVFENIRGWEANQGPFLYISNSTGNPASAAVPIISNLTFNNVSTADNLALEPIIEINSSGTSLQGVIIDMSIAGNGGSPAIQFDTPVTSGVSNCNIRSGGNSFTAFYVVDSSGNPLPGCSLQNRQGADYIIGAQGVGNGDTRLRSDIFAIADNSGPAVRATFAGNRFAGVALDPVLGLMLNTGSDFGFGGGINQSTRGAIDVEFPAIYPPTSLTGTPTTGGSIAAGTYYGTVYSSTVGSTCNSAESAPSIQSAAVTLSGSNNAIGWSWTLPIAGVSPVLGYCVAVSTTPDLNNGIWQPFQINFQFVAGGGATTLAMTMLPTTGGPNAIISTFLPVHRFTPNSLGVNTTRPAHNLDVLGDIHASTNMIVGSHLNSGASNSDLDGTITISSATSASHSFTTPFNVPPSCIIAPMSDPTSVGTWWVTTNATAVTANVHASGTITFDYHCTGNPN